jgi:hypothetical protein
MGRLSLKDKVRLARLKLRGTGRACYSALPQLKADDVTYEAFQATFVKWFKDKHRDQYNYARLQNASQEKNESPEMYLDRLQKLCQQLIQGSNNPAEQAVINREADRRLLAAFIIGLRGVPGRQVRLQMPETVDKALNKAIVATNADKEERMLLCEDQGTSKQVFMVGGSHENIPFKKNEEPLGKFQWSSN